jgi:hypothetical protein
MKLTGQQLTDLRAGRTVELRHPFDEDHPLTQIEVRQQFRLTDHIWLELREIGADDLTEEYVYRVRRCAAPDAPRLLMPAGRPKHSELGYTDKAYLSLRDEPEAVDAATQARISGDGWAGFNQRERQRLVDRRMLAIEERLRLAWGDGQRLRIDMSDSLRAVERIVSAMERKTSQDRDAA